MPAAQPNSFFVTATTDGGPETDDVLEVAAAKVVDDGAGGSQDDEPAVDAADVTLDARGMATGWTPGRHSLVSEAKREGKPASRPEGFVPIGKSPGVRVPRVVKDITEEWLTAVYQMKGYLEPDGKVSKVHLKPLGDGLGVMGDLALVDVELEGARPAAPKSFVAKFSPVESSTPIVFLKNIFGTESHWYNDLVEEDQGLGRPAAFFIAAKLQHKRFWVRMPVFCMLVEKMPPPLYSRTSGCDHLPHLKQVMRALGFFHARWWGKEKRPPLEWVNHPRDLPFGLSKDLIRWVCKLCLPALGRCFPEAFEPILAWKPLLLKRLKWYTDQVFKPPYTLCHGDVHLDNIFFNDSFGENGLKLIDFGNIQFGQAGFDVAYFVGTNIPPETRRKHEEELMATYHLELVRGGVTGYSIDDVWRDYKLNVFRVLINIAFVCWSDFDKKRKKKVGIFAEKPTESDAKLKETYDAVNSRCAAALIDAKFDELLRNAETGGCCG